MQEFWYATTLLGDLRVWIALLVVVGSIIATSKRPSKRATHMILMMILTLILISLVVQAVKMAVDAPRICTPCPDENCTGQSLALTVQVDVCPPCNPYCPTDDPYAFPSGHAAIVFGMVTAAWLTVLRNTKERAKFVWVFVVPVVVGASRIALGVHTPEQVVAGAVIGVAVAALVWLFLRRKCGI